MWYTKFLTLNDDITYHYMPILRTPSQHEKVVGPLTRCICLHFTLSRKTPSEKQKNFSQRIYLKNDMKKKDLPKNARKKIYHLYLKLFTEQTV